MSEAILKPNCCLTSRCLDRIQYLEREVQFHTYWNCNSPDDTVQLQSGKANQPWIFIGGTDAEVEAPILWLPDVKSQLIGKDPDAGKGWGQEEKGVTENEMVGWHHWLSEHEFEPTLRDSEGQGSLACCCSWGQKELDMTELLSNNNSHHSFPSMTALFHSWCPGYPCTILSGWLFLLFLNSNS